MPALADMLADLGEPTPAAVALALGVTVRTVERWRATGEAPRAAVLALFWVTRWGRSAVDAQAVNDARNAAGLARCLQDENDALRAALAAAEAMRSDGAANEPSLNPAQPARLRRG